MPETAVADPEQVIIWRCPVCPWRVLDEHAAGADQDCEAWLDGDQDGPHGLCERVVLVPAGAINAAAPADPDPQLEVEPDPEPVVEAPDPHEAARVAHANELLEYHRGAYNVPAWVGRRIEFSGRPGVITGARGPHLLVLLDGALHARALHPTYRIDYLEAE